MNQITEHTNAKHAAQQFYDDAKKDAVIALPGGNSIKKLYPYLEKSHNYVLADERYVPLHHQQSNYKQLTDETELTISPMNTDLPAKVAAKEYNEKHPRIDAAILGVGGDGHIASIFPEKTYADKKVYEVVKDSPKPPSTRITLTPQAIKELPVVLLLFIGDHKQEAYQAFKDNKDIPAQLARNAKHLHILRL